MRILIINELIKKGGTEVQSHREKQFFTKKGHEVYMLTFDPNEPELLEGTDINVPCRYNLPKRTYHRLFPSSFETSKIKRIIDGIAPDVIHINNVWRLGIDVMKAVKSYPVVQTNRDYGSVCPKLTCIHEDSTPCRGYRYEQCMKCIHCSLELFLKYLGLKIYNKVRRESVNQFVSPSNALAVKCTKNGIPTLCLNNPFDFSLIENEKKEFEGKKTFLYYGLISEMKGVSLFFKALDLIDTSNIHVLFIGEIAPEYKQDFQREISEREYAQYLGKKSYKDIMKMYKSIYCVVVPSLWIENYPNTVLEAIANKTLVIGSNRGGIPELIGNDRFLFEITEINSFVKCINNVLEMTESEYVNVTSSRYSYILANNSQEKYYNSLMSIYFKITNTN